jgi:hypothetical protein
LKINTNCYSWRYKVEMAHIREQSAVLRRGALRAALHTISAAHSTVYRRMMRNGVARLKQNILIRKLELLRTQNKIQLSELASLRSNQNALHIERDDAQRKSMYSTLRTWLKSRRNRTTRTAWDRWQRELFARNSDAATAALAATRKEAAVLRSDAARLAGTHGRNMLRGATTKWSLVRLSRLMRGFSKIGCAAHQHRTSATLQSADSFAQQLLEEKAKGSIHNAEVLAQAERHERELESLHSAGVDAAKQASALTDALNARALQGRTVAVGRLFFSAGARALRRAWGNMRWTVHTDRHALVVGRTQLEEVIEKYDPAEHLSHKVNLEHNGDVVGAHYRRIQTCTASMFSSADHMRSWKRGHDR